MVYSNTAGAIILISVIFLLSFMFERRYFKYFMSLVFICTGLLSFYIFYYIGSYRSTGDDVDLKVNLAKQNESDYLLNIDINWRKKIEIFGLNGNTDALIVRYDPEQFQIVSAEGSYEMGALGTALLELPDEFEYSKIKGNESEMRFDVKDGEGCSKNISLKNIKPGGVIQVFFVHDYKIPLETRTYWEKCRLIELKTSVHHENMMA